MLSIIYYPFSHKVRRELGYNILWFSHIVRKDVGVIYYDLVT